MFPHGNVAGMHANLCVTSSSFADDVLLHNVIYKQCLLSTVHTMTKLSVLHSMVKLETVFSFVSVKTSVALYAHGPCVFMASSLFT